MFKVQHTPRHLKRLNAITAEMGGRGSNKLAARIEKALIEGNRRDRLRGVDRRGRAMPSVKRRTGKYKGKTGPPLVPSGASSRAVTGYYARVTRRFGFFGDFTVKAGIYAEKAYIFPFHALGRGRWGRVPVRDILGTTPMTYAAIRSLFREWVQKRGRI